MKVSGNKKDYRKKENMYDVVPEIHRHREYASELHGTLIAGDGEFHDEKTRTHPAVGTESDGVNASVERCRSDAVPRDEQNR